MRRDVEADGSVEFQRVAAGSGFRRAVHHADLHPDLIDKDHHGVGFVDRGGELAQRLAHQPRLQARQRIAHFTLEFGARHQGRHRIHYQHVDRAGAHQRVADFQRLFAGVGLRDQQFVDIDAEFSGIDRVERVFGVDEGADAALALAFRHRMQRQRGLARGFRPVNLDHPPPRQSADAERDIEPERARGNRLDIHRAIVFCPASSPSPCRTGARSGKARRTGPWSCPWRILRRYAGQRRTLAGAPYGGDSLAGQTIALRQRETGRREHCTLFVLSSQYVLFGGGVLACFNPQWPNLNFAVA